MINQMARADYERATRKAFWNQIKNWLTGRNNELLPYKEVHARLPIVSQHDIGLSVVPLEQIVGSLGRYRDFDRAFLPIQTNTRDRWIRVDKAYYQDIILPPVDLYKIGEAYFVKDGNHRISVARQREQEYIDAWVTEIETPVPITPDVDLDEVLRRIEKVDFFLKTKLDSLRPDHQIRLTLPGYYEKLLTHINAHRCYLGIENSREMEWEETVESWYDHVYLPLIEYIRAEKILEDFPERTETDLYLWIIEHRASLGGDPNHTSVEEAASDFVKKNSEKPSKKFLRSVKETIENLDEVTEKILIYDMIGTPLKNGNKNTEPPQSEKPGSMTMEGVGVVLVAQATRSMFQPMLPKAHPMSLLTSEQLESIGLSGNVGDKYPLLFALNSINMTGQRMKMGVKSNETWYLTPVIDANGVIHNLWLGLHVSNPSGWAAGVFGQHTRQAFAPTLAPIRVNGLEGGFVSSEPFRVSTLGSSVGGTFTQRFKFIEADTRTTMYALLNLPLIAESWFGDTYRQPWKITPTTEISYKVKGTLSLNFLNIKLDEVPVNGFTMDAVGILGRPEALFHAN